MLCGNYFQMFNCINNFIRSVIFYEVFPWYLPDSSNKKKSNYYKSKWGKYRPEWETSVRFMSCNKLNWAGNDSVLWVHSSVCTSVPRQRAALTGPTESRVVFYSTWALRNVFLHYLPSIRHIPCFWAWGLLLRKGPLRSHAHNSDFCIEHAQFRKKNPTFFFTSW